VRGKRGGEDVTGEENIPPLVGFEKKRRKSVVQGASNQVANLSKREMEDGDHLGEGEGSAL